MLREHFGEEGSGFVVEADQSLLRVRAFGFWDDHTAAEFAPAVVGAFRRLGKEQLILDVRELRPMRASGQTAIALALRTLAHAPLVIVVKNQITKLQLLRIVREQRMSGAVRFTES